MLIQNKKAYFNYTVEKTLEAGVALYGWEVKSIKNSNTNIGDSFVVIENDEVFVLNWHIDKYKANSRMIECDTLRKKKLLLHKKEIKKLSGLVKRNGYTIILTKCYDNKNAIIKVEVALVKGKKEYDKREYIKERDARKESSIKFKA
jgi:SsrA-binding protein